MPFSEFTSLLKKVSGANSVKEARKWIEHHPDAVPKALRAMSERARHRPPQLLSILYVANDYVQHVLDRHERGGGTGEPWVSAREKALWQASIGEILDVCVDTRRAELPKDTHANTAKLLHTWLRKKAFDSTVVAQWRESVAAAIARGDDGASSPSATDRPRKRSRSSQGSMSGAASAAGSARAYTPSEQQYKPSLVPRQNALLDAWRQDVHSFVMCKFIADLCSDLKFPPDRLGLVRQTAHVYFHLWFHQIEKEKHAKHEKQVTQAVPVGGAWGGTHGYAVATTCVLLASKQEDSPKRLSTLVAKLGRRLPRAEFDASQKRALQQHDEALRDEQRLLAAWREAPEGSKHKEDKKLKWQEARCTCGMCTEIIRLELELLYGLGFDTTVTHPLTFWGKLIQPLFAGAGRAEAAAGAGAGADTGAVERLKQASWEMIGLASHTAASIRHGIHNVACASLVVAARCTGTESALPEKWIENIAIPIRRRAGGENRHPLTLENVDKASAVLQRFLDWWQQQQPTSSEKRRKSALFSPRAAGAGAGARATPSQTSSSSGPAVDAASSSSRSSKGGGVSSLAQYRELKQKASDASLA